MPTKLSTNRFNQAYNTYFRFNNARTLSTNENSKLNLIEAEGMTAYIDSTRRYDNQVIIHTEASLNTLSELLSRYSTETPPEISIEPDALTDSLTEYLRSQHYKPAFEHEFLSYSMPDLALPVTPGSIAVEQYGVEKADAFLALLKTSGLACSDEIWQNKKHFYCSDTFRCYVASIDNEPCAWATLFIDGDVATLANAFTQEAYRGKGCQTALLHTRIVEAQKSGVKVLLTDVMPNSTSSKNCKAVGFATVTVRSVWERSS